jgi:cation transport regulator ChaC
MAPQGDAMPLYFAYASNMDREHMTKLCPQAEALGLARIDNHRFFVAAGGYGSIAPRRGASVLGVLWRISAKDRVALDRYESVETGLYRAATLTVHHADKLLKALVYIASNATPTRPRPAYRQMVLMAARDWGLPDEYIDGLEQAMMRP